MATGIPDSMWSLEELVEQTSKQRGYSGGNDGKMMDAKEAAAVLICASILSGCANLEPSSEQLRANPHQKGTVSFADPYPVILANITASANKCFPTRKLSYSPGYVESATAPEMTVRSDELESGKLAIVEGLTRGGLDPAEDVFMSLDIRATPSGTEVDYYISPFLFGRYDNSSSFVPLANAWAHGDATKCD